MPANNSIFGRLLKAGLNSIATIEGKTSPVIDEEIGDLVGLAGTSIQRYRSGFLPSGHDFTHTVAELCISRGFMGRRWLESFLKAASYPPFEARALLARLFPESPAPAHMPHPHSNLPPPHGRFIMRRAAYDATLAGLQSELALTAIVSLGGMGKSSLARAVAADCLTGRAGPSFPIVAWVSDKDRPGATNLSVTLDELAYVLDYPGLIDQPFTEKRRAIEALLRAQPVLLILDNAETITDQALLEWLCVLPAPSKALVTSRASLPAHIAHHLVELEPFDAGQSRELIADRLAQSSWRARADLLPQLLPLAEVAGGNPKAIELALSVVLRQRRPLDDAIGALRAASIAELFDDLFARAWALLGSEARRALLAMPLFAGSVSEAALAYIADLSPAAAERVLTQLVDLALLDDERADLRALPRYTTHPLVRAFASARLADDPIAEAGLRERWLRWCAELGEAVGFCWYDLDRLARLDDEHEALQAALEWAAEHAHDRETLQLCEGLRYYYNVRGLWDARQLQNYDLRLHAAQCLGDRSEVVLALTQRAEICTKQGQFAQAADWLRQAQEIVAAPSAPDAATEADRREGFEHLEYRASAEALSSDAQFELGHAQALLAHARGELAAAEAQWRAMLPFSRTLDAQKYVINRRWLATCLLDQGRIDEAAALYRESLDDARRANDTRSVTGNTLKLATIDLGRGDLIAAAASLSECRATAARYNDRRRLAECHRLTARLHLQQGDHGAARAELVLAIDLFDRLGMGRELAESQAELVRVDGIGAVSQ